MTDISVCVCGTSLNESVLWFFVCCSHLQIFVRHRNASLVKPEQFESILKMWQHKLCLLRFLLMSTSLSVTPSLLNPCTKSFCAVQYSVVLATVASLELSCNSPCFPTNQAQIRRAEKRQQNLIFNIKMFLTKD